MGWQQAAKGFREIPVGMSARKIWLDPYIFPLVGAIGFSWMLCGGFMMKYFTGHSDIHLYKSNRKDPDHYGGSERRTMWHNSHFGMREVNKSNVTLFPFQFTAMQDIIDKHGIGKRQIDIYDVGDVGEPWTNATPLKEQYE